MRAKLVMFMTEDFTYLITKPIAVKNSNTKEILNSNLLSRIGLISWRTRYTLYAGMSQTFLTLTLVF